MEKKVQLFAVWVLPACWLMAVQHDPFFWDTVQLASKQAHFFYAHQLQWAALPSDIDSGHPPLLGYYLAILWTFFGKTLVVSHWAMYPFLTAIVWLLIELGRNRGAYSTAWYLLPLCLLDPVLAGQAALVSPDIVVVFGLLAGIYGFYHRQKGWIITGFLILCLISMRGMMTAAGLALWMWLELGRRLRSRQFVQPVLVAFRSVFLWALPGALAGAAFLGWHYQATGWVGHFEGSTWSAAFEKVGASGFVRNVAIVGWRWTDMDRFVEWGVLLWLIYRVGLRRFLTTNRDLLLLLLILVLFLTPSALLYKNLSAHRYFLPVFMAMHLLVFEAISNAGWSAIKKQVILSVLVVAMAVGNFWVYPRGVSMDWDSTLAHLPYHPLRAEAMRFFEENQIDLKQVGTTFPNLNTGENLLLNGDERSLSPLNFDTNEWIMTSNVFNDVDEEEYEVLERDWQRAKRWQQAGVWMEVWRRNH